MKSAIAIYYMIFSVLAFALMNAVVKYLAVFNVYQLVFFRSVGTLFFTIPFIIKRKIPFFGTHKKLLLIRGVVGVISLTCFFQSLDYLAVGTAVSLRYTSPIFAAILAYLFLKEKIKTIQYFLFTIALIGVLIIKGFGAHVHTIGLILILISALFHGFVFVLIRKIGDRENPFVIINYFMIMAFVFGGIMSINHWRNPNLSEWILLLSLGVFGYIGQLYMTKAFQANETNVVAPLQYLEIVFTMIIGVLWFGDVYNLWTLLGIFLILFGLIYNIYLKRKKS
jgi:drug/metabolite transporter (DMT)-like permease